MFVMHLLPAGFLNLIINLILFAGILSLAASFLVRYLPFVRPYQTPAMLAGIVLLVIGVYWKGGYSVEMDWRKKVEELEAKLVVAEAKSQQVNTVIKTEVVTKIQKVKEVKYRNKEVIKEVEKVIDRECTVAPEAIEILNAAARNEAVILKGVDQ